MPKHTHHASGRGRRAPKEDGPPLVVVVFVAGGILFGYLGGELAFAHGPHPYHWAAGLVGGVLAWIAGEIVYRLRGDIV